MQRKSQKLENEKAVLSRGNRVMLCVIDLNKDDMQCNEKIYEDLTQFAANTKHIINKKTTSDKLTSINK